jgi:hypothetical protein
MQSVYVARTASFIDSVRSNHLAETTLCNCLELTVFCFKDIITCLEIHKDLTRSTGYGSNMF